MSRAPHIHNVLCMAPEHCVNCEYSCRVRFISNARNGSSILLFTVHTGSHSVNSLYPRLSCLRALLMLCCCAVCTLYNVFFSIHSWPTVCTLNSLFSIFFSRNSCFAFRMLSVRNKNDDKTFHQPTETSANALFNICLLLQLFVEPTFT